MKPLSNNQELYDYLLLLSSQLKQRDLQELSEVVLFASRQASGMSTEFLGESRIALRQVLQKGAKVLTEQERECIKDVLKQLDTALDKR